LVSDAASVPYRLLGHLDRLLAGLQLRHRTFGLGELAAVAAFPECAPDQGPGGLDLRRHVGQHEGDRLVLDERATELLALLRVLERELEGGAGDPERLRADDRARELKRLQGDRGPRVLPLSRPG